MAVINASGRHYLDGIDMWTAWGIFVESGSDGFLKIPPRKESITHDWLDQDGLDVDLVRIFFKDRDVTLQCALIAIDANDFWAKRDSFIAQIKQPGQRRIEVNEFGTRSFFVFYKECIGFNRLTRLLDLDGSTPLVASKFTIVFTENEPGSGSGSTGGGSGVYIVDEDNRFLVT